MEDTYKTCKDVTAAQEHAYYTRALNKNSATKRLETREDILIPGTII